MAFINLLLRAWVDPNRIKPDETRCIWMQPDARMNRCGGFNFPPCSVFRMTKYGDITSCDACAQQAKVVNCYSYAALSPRKLNTAED